MLSKLSLAGFTDEYKVGIEEIDDQHKAFFDMLDKIGDIVPDLYKPLDDDEADELMDITSELRDYALLHFRTEESYMKEVNYPGLEEQKTQHNHFIQDVIRMEAQIMNGSAVPPIKIRNFMHDWYRDHILNLDKPFSDFYKENSK